MAIVRKLFYALLVLFSIISSVVGVCVYFIEYISPGKVWLITFSALFYPLFLLINFFCIFCWLLRKRYFSLFLWICIIPAILTIGEMFNVSFPKEKSVEGTELTIMTYNVGRFAVQVNAEAEIDDWIKKDKKIDILCLQEFWPKKKGDNTLFQKYPYKVESGKGTIIYSKYPIKETGNKVFKGSANSMVWADILVGKEKIRVVDVHMQTTNVSIEERNIRNSVDTANNEEIYRKGVTAIKHMQENYLKRAEQAEQVRELIQSTKYPVILCGDFNDTPYSYCYHLLKGDLNDGFVECATGWGYTFRRFYGMLRIDYIMYSNSLEGIFYESPSVLYSDHNPVIMSLILKK